MVECTIDILKNFSQNTFLCCFGCYNWIFGSSIPCFRWGWFASSVVKYRKVWIIRGIIGEFHAKSWQWMWKFPLTIVVTHSWVIDTTSVLYQWGKGWPEVACPFRTLVVPKWMFAKFTQYEMIDIWGIDFALTHLLMMSLSMDCSQKRIRQITWDLPYMRIAYYT